MPKTVQELVAEAKGRIENLSVEQVEQEMGGGAVVVDIRESEELAEVGRIPGSVHLPRGVLEFKAAGALDPSQRIILHCAAGGRSALAAVALQELGYENVAHLEGGFGAWKESGRPVEGG